MTDPLSALLKSILLEPDVDLHRLAFADRLEEEGDRQGLARAEFIRVQLRLADLNAELMSAEDCGHPNCEGCKERRGLMARSRELLDAHGEEWTPACLLAPSADGTGWRWGRGFIESVTCAAADWLSHADAILASHPVTSVTLTTLPAIQGRHQGRCRLHGRERWHAVGWSDPRDALPYLLRQEWPGIKFELPRAVSGPANLYVNGNFLGTATAWEGGILHGNPEAGKPLGTINVKETVKQVAKNVAEAWAARPPVVPARPIEEDLSVEDAIREARRQRRKRKSKA